MTPPERAPKPGSPPRPAAFAVAVHFALRGDLRYLAHHDEMRMLTRALVRAGWPVCYSGGFNPKPRIHFPLPRNLGVASEAELAVVDLRESRSAAALAESLAAALPEGCALLRIEAPAPCRAPAAEAVEYALPLAEPDAQRVAPRIAALLAQPQLVIERSFGPDKPTRRVDIRPFVNAIVLDGARLHLRVRVEQQRSARPAEILSCLGLDAAAYECAVCRVAVEWRTERPAAPRAPAANEGNELVQEEDPDATQEPRAKVAQEV